MSMERLAPPGRTQKLPRPPAGLKDELARFPSEILAACLKFCQVQSDIATGTKSTETT